MLAINRAREAFGLSKDEWGVNVQPLSGSPANMAVCVKPININDIMNRFHLSLPVHLCQVSKPDYRCRNCVYL